MTEVLEKTDDSIYDKIDASFKEHFDKYKESIKDISEVQLYFLIEEGGIQQLMLAHTINSYMKKSELTEDDEEYLEHLKKDHLNISIILAYTSNQSRRFGVDITEWSEDNLFPDPTDSYWNWYKFWNDWDKTLHADKFKELHAKLANGEDVSEYLPKKNN